MEQFEKCKTRFSGYQNGEPIGDHDVALSYAPPPYLQRLHLLLQPPASKAKGSG